MRFRRRRKTVRWLPDKSWFSLVQHTGVTSAALPHIATMEQELLTDPGTGEGVPTALASTNFNSSRTNVDTLILDHISGQIHWNITNNANVAGADASGIWEFYMGAAIWIAARSTQAAGAVAPVTINSADTASMGIFSPAADPHPMQQGSFVADGLRVLWRRTWNMGVDFSGTSPPKPELTSSTLTPPGSYVDIKPHRILRPNEVLMAGILAYMIGGVGAGGSVMVAWSPDLRIAAHNTTRRR